MLDAEEPWTWRYVSLARQQFCLRFCDNRFRGSYSTRELHHLIKAQKQNRTSTYKVTSNKPNRQCETRNRAATATTWLIAEIILDTPQLTAATAWIALRWIARRTSPTSKKSNSTCLCSHNSFPLSTIAPAPPTTSDPVASSANQLNSKTSTSALPTGKGNYTHTVGMRSKLPEASPTQQRLWKRRCKPMWSKQLNQLQQQQQQHRVTWESGNLKTIDSRGRFQACQVLRSDQEHLVGMRGKRRRWRGKQLAAVLRGRDRSRRTDSWILWQIRRSTIT